MNPVLIAKILEMILTAEPAVVQAIHNLLSGTGTADDIAVLKGDAIAWQAIADKAAVEIAKGTPPTPPSVVTTTTPKPLG
jgi:hypothetical protein